MRLSKRQATILAMAAQGKVYEVPGEGARSGAGVCSKTTLDLRRVGILGLSIEESPLTGYRLWRPTDLGLEILKASHDRD